MLNPNKEFQVLRKIEKILTILLLLLVTSCNEKETEPKEERRPVETKPDPTPVDPPVELKKGWFPEYEAFLKTKISKEQTPSLWKYSPNIKYWLLTFRSMTAAESAFEPWNTYWEKSLGVSCLSVWDKDRCEYFVKKWNEKQTKSSRYAAIDEKGWDRATKTFYLSEGLLQLSYSDKNYYGCDFDWEKDQYKVADDRSKTIFNPYKNLACGVVILERQLKKVGKLYYDKSYWAVLRTNRQSHKNYLWYFNKYKAEYGY